MPVWCLSLILQLSGLWTDTADWQGMRRLHWQLRNTLKREYSLALMAAIAEWTCPPNPSLISSQSSQCEYINTVNCSDRVHYSIKPQNIKMLYDSPWKWIWRSGGLFWWTMEADFFQVLQMIWFGISYKEPILGTLQLTQWTTQAHWIKCVVFTAGKTVFSSSGLHSCLRAQEMGCPCASGSPTCEPLACMHNAWWLRWRHRSLLTEPHSNRITKSTWALWAQYKEEGEDCSDMI